MARILVVELLDALTEIGLNYVDADRSHVIAKTALLGQHRFALDERFGAVILKDAMHDLVMLGGVSRPVDMDAVRVRIGRKRVEILVEGGERVFFDGGS